MLLSNITKLTETHNIFPKNYVLAYKERLSNEGYVQNQKPCNLGYTLSMFWHLPIVYLV